MTTTGKAIITALSIVLAGLVVLAIAGFAFFASAEGESSGTSRKVSGAPSITAVWEGAVS